MLEKPQILQVGPFVDAKEGADYSFAQIASLRQHDHRAVAIRQTSVIEALEQGCEVGQVAELAAQLLVADLLLKDRTHPLERSALGLISPTRLWRSCGDPPNISEELLGAVG